MKAEDWAAWAAGTSALLSAIAAAIAAWSVSRTRTDVRLQLASVFVTDLAAWGAGVLEYQARAIPLFMVDTPKARKRALVGAMYNDLNFHITKGGLYVGAAESAPVIAATVVLNQLRTYHERLISDDLGEDESNSYLKLFDAFVNDMRIELGLKRRYEIAKWALR